MRNHELKSTHLGGARQLDVYTTPAFKAGNGITPVVIFFDGEESRVLSRATTILDNLYAERRIPPMMAVFVTQQDRWSELTCSEATSLFVVNEILPWLRQEYKVKTTPAQTVLAGSSFGGLQAACTALHHLDAVGRVLSQSGSFWWGKTEAEPEGLTAELESRPKVNVKFYLDVGLMEGVGGRLSQLSTNRRLREVMQKKGYKVIYREFNGTHAYPCWRAGLGDALVDLLAD